MKFKVVGKNPTAVSVDGKQYEVDKNKMVTIDGTLTEATMRHLIDFGWRPADDGAAKFVAQVPGCKEILDREAMITRQREDAQAAAEADTLRSGGSAALAARNAELEVQLAAALKSAGKGK